MTIHRLSCNVSTFSFFLIILISFLCARGFSTNVSCKDLTGYIPWNCVLFTPCIHLATSKSSVFFPLTRNHKTCTNHPFPSENNFDNMTFVLTQFYVSFPYLPHLKYQFSVIWSGATKNGAAKKMT